MTDVESDLDRHQHDDEEPKKPSTQILQHELAEARAALDRSTHRLFISGVSAGLDLGFSVLLIAVLKTSAAGVLSPPILDLLLAAAYSFGFLLVILGRSELFTEQTSLAVLPLLSRQTSFKRVARLWVIVYVSNLVGAAAFAAMAVSVGPALDVADRQVFGEIANQVVDHSGWTILLSGILAGWLMGLLSWLVAAGRDTISQIVIVWLITGAIGLAHLHHCIVGTTEVLAGVFVAHTSAADFAHFLLCATLGNAIGGPFFVALIKYGIARPGRHGPALRSSGRVRH